MLELLYELRYYLESTMYSTPGAEISGWWFCPECARLIRSTNLFDKTKRLEHDSVCKLNELMNKTIQKIEELENDKRTD